MSGLKACLIKDLKLFFKRAGILSLLLPLFLYAAMFFGFRSFSSSTAMQPFAVAIRDQDQSLMSRNLILQMKKIPMFSEVRVLEEDVTDLEALEDGAAAVVTIPQWLFYKMYAVEDCPVEMVLNDRMEVPAALFRSIFSSVMSIVEHDESAFRGAYRYVYTLQDGPEAAAEKLEDPEIRESINRKASEQLLDDALGRQNLFDTEYSPAKNMISAVSRDTFASIFLIMVLGYAVTALKTIPEERKLGVIPRLEALGHSSIIFYLSKLITVYLLFLPILAGLFVLLEKETFLLILPWTMLLIATGFFEILLIAEFAKDSRYIQQLGNLYLLLMLICGGTLWPRAALPGFLRALSGFSVSYYFAEILEIATNGRLYTPELILRSTCIPPLLIIGAALLLVVVKNVIGKLFPTDAAHHAFRPQTARFALSQSLSLVRWKARVFFGGPARILCILCFAVLLLFSVENAVSRRESSVRITVQDLDRTSYSESLIRALDAREGVTVTDEGGLFSLDAAPEGTLTIPKGYGAHLENAEEISVHYEAAKDTYSELSTREIISGEIIAQQSLYKARAMAEDMLGRALSEEEFSEMTAMIRAELDAMPDMFRIRSRSDLENGDNRDGKTTEKFAAGVVETFLPDTWTFSILIATIFALTYTSVRGSKGMIEADRRLRILPRGRFLSVFSDTLPIAALLLSVQIASLALSGKCSLYPVLASVLFSFLMAQFGLWISSIVSTEGRVDGLACFLSILILLIGGCFIDFTALSDSMRAVSWISPAGLARSVTRGDFLAAAILLMENMVIGTVLTVRNP